MTEEKDKNIRTISAERVSKSVDEIFEHLKVLGDKCEKAVIFELGYCLMSIIFGFFPIVFDVGFTGFILSHIGWLLSFLAMVVYSHNRTAYMGERRGIRFGLRKVLDIGNEK